MKYAMNSQNSRPVTASDELSAKADLRSKSSAAGRSQKVNPLTMKYAMNSQTKKTQETHHALP
jgi:hypothetical protein